MGDLPPTWTLVQNLPDSGQSYTFVVRRSDGSDSGLHVLKRLKNPKRESYFEREIQACTTLNHPNETTAAYGIRPRSLPSGPGFCEIAAGQFHCRRGSES